MFADFIYMSSTTGRRLKGTLKGDNPKGLSPLSTYSIRTY